MAQRERSDPLTDEQIEAVAAAADDLGERLVEALAEETGGEPEAFDIDDAAYEFPEPRE